MTIDNDDGEIHALSENYAYILTTCDEDFTHEEIDALLREHAEKYALYLYENDKEKVLKMITNSLMPGILNGYYTDTEVCVVLRPKIYDKLNQKSSLVLKFKRAKNDNLG
jgi:hypothetical protein